MKVRALISFASLEATLSIGQEAELSQEVANSLLTAKHIEKVEEEKPTKKKAVKKDESK